MNQLALHLSKISLTCIALMLGLSSSTESLPLLVVASGEVTPLIETQPVPSIGDAADDAAIWIHPQNTSQSTIIGTDKKSGLLVYNLAGVEIQSLPDGNLNNVDLRYNFPLGGHQVALVSASNRTDDSIALYKVNPITLKLEDVAARKIITGTNIYGLCMYRSAHTGNYFVFVTFEDGRVEQWRLFDAGNGKVDGVLVRGFDVGSQSEGCVADDEFPYLYIAEESTGIWRYGAEPGDGDARTLIDSTGSGKQLVPDVEGLSIYYTSVGTGYLIASSQGNSTFVIYQREEGNKYVMTFEIMESAAIDRVSQTDGIDVTNFPLGSDFPQGVFVAQDGNNDPANQNFKLVTWQMIANAADPPLSIDVSWDPRQVGAGPPIPPPELDSFFYLPITMSEPINTLRRCQSEEHTCTK